MKEAAAPSSADHMACCSHALMIGLDACSSPDTTHRAAPDGRLPDPDIGFIDEMGWLMVWGTTLLVIDAI
ncbi:hypothetical protein ACFSQT_37640 [Mesorhizobium calcicola]|uniref:Vitamin uptake-like sensor domain-containing protein n=1 Tax=Mesorhizobium calcicola TaxID=1300310 RepID=A0ABW4WRL1_9HYPH